MNIEDIKKQLHNASIKVTHPRVVILKALREIESHPTAEELFASVGPENPSISLASIYRVLDVLVEKELIHKVSVSSGSKRYDGNILPHGHLFCTKSNKLQDFYDEELYELLNAFFKKKKVKNFKVQEIKLQVNGETIDPSKEIIIQ